MIRLSILAGVVAICASTTGATQQTETLQGTTYRSPGGTTLRLMLDDSNVGPEVTLGEMVFPPNQDSGNRPARRDRDVLRRLGRARARGQRRRARS